MPNKLKRRKVASGAEVITSAKMLEILKSKEHTKSDKKVKLLLNYEEIRKKRKRGEEDFGFR